MIIIIIVLFIVIVQLGAIGDFLNKDVEKIILKQKIDENV